MRVARIALFATLLASGCGKTARDPPPPLVWHSLAEGEALAKKEHKLAVVFFGAEWSTADMMLEHETFPSPEVRAALHDWIVIKVDCTDDEDRETDKAKERFHIVGVPTVLGVDFSRPIPPAPSGPTYDVKDLFRINEFVDPPKLAAALRAGSVKAKPLRAEAH